MNSALNRISGFFALLGMLNIAGSIDTLFTLTASLKYLMAWWDWLFGSVFQWFAIELPRWQRDFIVLLAILTLQSVRLIMFQPLKDVPVFRSYPEARESLDQAEEKMKELPLVERFRGRLFIFNKHFLTVASLALAGPLSIRIPLLAAFVATSFTAYFVICNAIGSILSIPWWWVALAITSTMAIVMEFLPPWSMARILIFANVASSSDKPASRIRKVFSIIGRIFAYLLHLAYTLPMSVLILAAPPFSALAIQYRGIMKLIALFLAVLVIDSAVELTMSDRLISPLTNLPYAPAIGSFELRQMDSEGNVCIRATKTQDGRTICEDPVAP